MDYPDIFNKCIKIILRNEGGYVNHPSDPGGETNMGIAKRFYPNLDIENLTEEEAIKIYYEDYWLPAHLDKLNNDDLVLQIFDMSVSAGIKMAIKLLQRLVGVKDDGILGDVTARAVREFNGDVEAEYRKRRKLFYVTLVQKKEELRVFIKGWLARVDKCHF